MRYKSYRGYGFGPIGFLVVANLLVFFVTLVKPDLIYLLGLQPAALQEKPWTMLSNLFVHGGFGHIIANMFTLYFFGTYLLGLVGTRAFLLVYFLGGITGNIVYILLASPFSVAIGASGAIFALGGALAVMRPRLSVFVFPIPVPIPLWAAVIGGFLIMLFPGVAWQAHLGGLVLGLIAGYFFRRRERRLF